MVLLVGFYNDPSPARTEEFLECLRRNVANSWVREIHLWVEFPVPPEQLVLAHPLLMSPKLRLLLYGRRITFHELISYANRQLPGCQVGIANADIFFDESLRRLEGYDLAGALLCLSRWDVLADGSTRLFRHPLSQDAWIFQSPVKELACDFPLGVPGCDNRLAWEARQAGLKLSNPAKTLRAYHLHLSGVRHYSERERLRGSGCLVPLEELS